MQTEFDAISGGDSEDDFDWEEVAVPLTDQQGASTASTDAEAVEGPSTFRPSIEITIQAKPKKDDTEK